MSLTGRGLRPGPAPVAARYESPRFRVGTYFKVQKLGP